MEAGASPPRRRAAGTIALVGLVPFVVWFALADHSRLTDPLTFVLAAGALTANLLEVRVEGSMWVSAAFICGMVAAAFLGPGPAFGIVAFAGLGVWLHMQFQLDLLAINAFGAIAPTMLAAAAMTALAPDPLTNTLGFDAVLAGVTTGALALNMLLVLLLGTWRDGGQPLTMSLTLSRQFLPLHAITIAMVVIVAQAYGQIGLTATTSLIVAALAFTYVVQLLATARQRAQEIETLSEGRGRLVAEALNAEDRERRLLAERLHDHAVQNLLAVRQDLEEAGGASVGLSRASRAVEETVEQLRAAAFDLHPTVLEQAGLKAGLQAVAEQQAERAGFRVSIFVDPNARGVNDQLMFSIGRELILNVAKHAHASALEVRVEANDGALRLEVADDGIGFDEARRTAAVLSGHIGLASTGERIAALGGLFDIDSALGRGTRVHVAVPFLGAS